MAFWKPGTLAPGSQVDREAGKESEAIIVTFSEAQYATMSVAEQRQQLPVYKHRIEFLYLLENYQVVILVGQTGSGKTTQIPQYLHEAGWTAKGKVVGCTQPRRVAATTVAQRVAEEMHVKLGMDVGYVIRFEDCTDPGGNTRIKYMTDGMLFRETLVDPLLSKYSVIMLDEAHERSLYTDILMGVLKKILKKRQDLRVVISSATLDAEAFVDFFSSGSHPSYGVKAAVILSVEGRQYPVDIHYLDEPCSDYVEQAIQTVFDIHTKEPAGDILVFMTGRDEIETVVSEIRERATTLPPNKYAEILALPIYAGLQAEEQMLVFDLAEQGVRKVVIATNVAEASITIPGIGYVVDSGFVKLRAYNPRTGMETLTTTAISQASAHQRSGRAGRIKNGKAYRLYTEDSFQKNMRQISVPEIQRSNLAGLVLQLKALGIENVLRFDFMTSPPAELMSKALELLYSLGALDKIGRLTIPLGMHLAEFPLDPLLGKILLDSNKFGCSHEILTIAAMVSVQNIFINPTSPHAEEQHRRFGAQEGDHITLLNRYFAQAARIAPDGTHWISASELAAAGTASGDAVRLWMHPTSILFKQTPTWVIFHEVVQTGQGKAYMREVTVIEPGWLEELAPHFFTTKK
ncbi:ATPdependent RNA helicase [Podila clonocystis]|nr:ATPdependent RNA helicase [Podila clonocystis]